MRRCVPINEIEIGIWDEIERLSSWHEIEWQLRVVKLNEYLSKLNEIKFKMNDIKRNRMLKEWKWTMQTESWQKSLEFECNSNATLMKLGGKTYIINIIIIITNIIKIIVSNIFAWLRLCASERLGKIYIFIFQKAIFLLLLLYITAINNLLLII